MYPLLFTAACVPFFIFYRNVMDVALPRPQQMCIRDRFLDVYPVPEMVQQMALPVMAGSLLTDATMIRRHSLQDGTEVYTEAAATTSIIRLRAL